MNKLILLLISLGCMASVSAQTIKKCQDVDGNWHYGDHAAEECERARITELDESGTQMRQIKAPPTKEELAAKLRMEDKMAEQQRMDREQKILDARLLATYENADSISRTRDALLAAIDSVIATDQDLKRRIEVELAKLESDSPESETSELADELRSRINDFDRAIRDQLAKRERVKQRYEKDLSRFRELTGSLAE